MTQKSPTHAFVTGASGFLGAHTVYALLEKNYAVTGLVRNKENLAAFYALANFYPNADVSAVEWVEGDLLFPEGWLFCLADADVVFHTAAVVSFLPKDHKTMMETNVLGTEHVVNACLKQGHKPLIYVSSVAALGRSEDTSVVTENNSWKDSDYNTGYAVSKHLAEREVWRGVEEGLPATVVCPGIIIGPWSKNTGSGQIPALVKRKLPLYPIGENGFVGVRDVVAMMVALYESRQFGKRFLCVAENSSYKNVLTLFAEGFGVPKPYIAIKGFLLRFLIVAARLFELLRLPFPFPSQGLKSTALITRYTTANKVVSFGYAPLKNTVKETCDAYNILRADCV